MYKIKKIQRSNESQKTSICTKISDFTESFLTHPQKHISSPGGIQQRLCSCGAVSCLTSDSVGGALRGVRPRTGLPRPGDSCLQHTKHFQSLPSFVGPTDMSDRYLRGLIAILKSSGQIVWLRKPGCYISPLIIFVSKVYLGNPLQSNILKIELLTD